MKLLETVEIKLQPSDIANLTQHPWRKYEVVKGAIGVTTILRHIALKMKLFTVEDEGDELPLRMLEGMGWEVSAAQLYKDMHWQPEAAVWDGIQGHPDGYSPIGSGYFLIDEFKRTSKSIRAKGSKDQNQLKDVRNEWMWMQQGMGYCNLNNLKSGEGVKQVRYHVNWSMGAYTWPYEARYLRYLVEFEDEELARNWAMLVKYRDEVRKEMGV